MLSATHLYHTLYSREDFRLGFHDKDLELQLFPAHRKK